MIPLLQTMDKATLPAVAARIKEVLGDDETPEASLLRDSFFQAYRMQVANLQARDSAARAQMHGTHEATASSTSSAGSSGGWNWQETAGRRTGSTSYTFGDLTLTVLNKLASFTGSRPMRKPDLGGDIVAGLLQADQDQDSHRDDHKGEPAVDGDADADTCFKTVNAFGSVQCRLMSYRRFQGQVCLDCGFVNKRLHFCLVVGNYY
jgi:hypothetical protein